MEPQELFNQLHNEIDALNTAFALRRITADNFSIVANDDNTTDVEYERAAAEMNEANIAFQRLDLTMNVRAEKMLGRGKPLSAFWNMVYKARQS